MGIIEILFIGVSLGADAFAVSVCKGLSLKKFDTKKYLDFNEKLKENLTTYAQDARDSKMLATIVCDVPLDYEWKDFEFDLTLDEEASELFQSLDLKSILNKLIH